MRWLSLDDWSAVRQLQARGVQLDLERAVLWPHTPLQAALRAPLPFSPIGAETLVLYPSAPQSARALGFAQIRARRGRPEADVVFLAPALDSCADAVSIWYRLLAECTRAIGARGGQRLFAQVASGNGAEEVFRQAGFVAYAREDIYRLHALPAGLTRQDMLRRQRARDGWNLLRMYAQLTPRPVQIAEGMLSPEGQGGKVGEWWDQSRGAGFVLEVGSEPVGAARLQRGRAAYWLRLGLSAQAQEHSETLLRGALASLWAAPRRPIYCGVRDYESGLAVVLARAGFERLGARTLMVKHITVRAKESLIQLRPTLEKRPEPAASASHRFVE